MNNPHPIASPILSRRSGGILLHPSSLPGPWGIGDLGPEACSFVDFLHATGQRLWEVLPMGPTGYGDSPYQGLSAFAGNPNLISPDLLMRIPAPWRTWPACTNSRKAASISAR